MFTSRIPADLQQKLTQTLAKAETYIATYNIFMGNIVDDNGKIMFDTSDILISHWGLRDKLKTFMLKRWINISKNYLLYYETYNRSNYSYRSDQ